MTGAEQFVVALAPIVLSVVSGWFAFVAARRVSERNAKAEAAAAKAEAKRLAEAAKAEADELALQNQRERREGYEALTANYRQEIDRLRTDREEDRRRHLDEIQGMARAMNELRTECANAAQRQEQHVRQLEEWARQVVDLLGRPSVHAALDAEGLRIPRLPAIEWPASG